MMHRVIFAAVLLAAFAQGSLAQRARPAQSDEDESAMLRISPDSPPKTKALPRVAGPMPRSYSYADWEVWRNITILPGQSVNLDSDIVFSTADTVRVSIRSRNTDLPYIVMNAYWAVPQAEFFNVADILTGDAFPYRNAGGATFNTYGSQFRLRLTNTGNSAMYLTQVVVFARVL